MIAARFALPLLSALCLSACAGGPATEAVGRYPASRPAPGSDAALASLPAAAGRVVALRTTARPNGLSQEIVLDGPRGMTGENRITVAIVTTAGGGGPDARGDALRLGPPSDTEVEAEMEASLPGVPMLISGAVERDALGAFGYASGSVGRLACVYAWQYLAPSRPLTLLEGASDTGDHPVSVRVRLCRVAPVAALVEDLRHLAVAVPGGTSSGVAAGGRTGGDALEAALGHAVDAAPVTASPTRSPRQAGPRPAARRHTRVRAAAPRIRRQAAPDLSRLPRLPMPGDVAGTGTASAGAAVGAPMPARSAGPDPEAMPLPR